MLIGACVVIFVLVFILLVHYRKQSLKKVEESIMESKLKVSPDQFGKLNATITKLWNTRADVSPIPELNHLAQGWSKDETGKVFSIREKIISSFHDLENKACHYNPSYARKPSICEMNIFVGWVNKKASNLIMNP